ncbi:MAG: thymidine kinase [Firmicutes bacterium]|nr:thymidine kinase [Bacillota bacterium]
MASLYFTYSAMNAGKSTSLLQVAHNYEERGQNVLLLTPALDTRGGVGHIHSRLGIDREALTFGPESNLFQLLSDQLAQGPLDCVLLDEAQFLSSEQVWALARVCDVLNVPVMCYGIRTDAFGQAFAGSAALLAIADKLVEMKTICHCGRKATMSLRVDAQGKAIASGEQISIGGNDRYVSYCRRHWLQALQEAGVDSFGGAPERSQ